MRALLPRQRPTKKERREMGKNSARLLKIDTAERVAMMDLNNFGRGLRLKKFFRQSFKVLKERNIQYLIIDVRNNGGGSPTNSTNLSRYLSDRRFKIGDSLFAVTKRKSYGRYIKGDFFDRLYMSFFTKRKSDGYYHIGYFERHYFKPKKQNHFDGKTYILSGGNSFSATTLFIGTLIKQENVTVVGEETGGGAYGNSAWHMPTVLLPETKVRLTLPLYRLVINKDNPKTGYGIQPEVKAGPSVEAIRKGTDYKLEKVMQLIKEDKGKKI
jgi:C-terminal processing protease CtpA/Prc